VTDPQQRPSVRPHKPRWFYEFRDEAVGPVDELALRRAAREGVLTRGTLVWRKTLDGWQPAAAVPEVLVILEQEAVVARTDSASPAAESGPDAAVAHAPVSAPAASGSPTQEPPASPSAPVPAEPSPAREVVAAAPPKPGHSEAAGNHELGDAISDDEELERPIREADVRELLERTRSSRPARGPASLSPPASGATSPPNALSTAASAASERASARDRVDPGPASPRPLPLWTKVVGVAVLLLLGMGAVLLTGRPHGAAERARAARAGRSGAAESPGASTESAEIAVASKAADSSLADQRASAVPARAAGAGEPGGTPAVVVTEGPLSPAFFQKQLDAAALMFDEQCWQKLRATEGEVAEHPSLEIELGISAWGQIEKLVAGEAPTGYRGVGRCVVGRIRGWKFPRASARTSVTLRIAPSVR
jgi:hypothetical protein